MCTRKGASVRMQRSLSGENASTRYKNNNKREQITPADGGILGDRSASSQQEENTCNTKNKKDVVQQQTEDRSKQAAAHPLTVTLNERFCQNQSHTAYSIGSSPETDRAVHCREEPAKHNEYQNHPLTVTLNERFCHASPASASYCPGPGCRCAISRALCERRDLTEWR